MADKSKKPKTGKPKAISALDIYQQQGCTLSALKLALKHGIDNKEKDLDKSLLKHIFPAAGQDIYRLHLQDANELNAALNLSVVFVDKNSNVQDWLDSLEYPTYWDSVEPNRTKVLLKNLKSLKGTLDNNKLATHIPGARNPDNSGGPKILKAKCNDLSAIAASEANLATAGIVDSAAQIRTRLFFEFVFYFAGTLSSMLAMLVDKDPKLMAYLKLLGLTEIDIDSWHSSAKQNPKDLSPLHAQLLFKTAHNETLSVTPMLSVAAASWLGQQSKSAYFSESAKYGGAHATNVAGVMSDFAGYLHHPTILPPPIKRTSIDGLIRLIHYPASLIKPQKLKSGNDLIRQYPFLSPSKLRQKLATTVNELLEELLADVIQLKDLLGSNNDEAISLKTSLEQLPKNSSKHHYLNFVLGIANDRQIKNIASTIVRKWLGSIEKMDGTRYQTVENLVAEQLHRYMQGSEQVNLINRLTNMLQRPGSLIYAKKLKTKAVNDLCGHYDGLSDIQVTQKLSKIISYLLKNNLTDISRIRNLLNSDDGQAIKFQNKLNGLTTTHRNLQFALRKASTAQIAKIADNIVKKWLDSVETIDHIRQEKITALVTAQLTTYMNDERN